MSLMVNLFNMNKSELFNENDLFTPVTPNDPRLTFDPMT